MTKKRSRWWHQLGRTLKWGWGPHGTKNAPWTVVAEASFWKATWHVFDITIFAPCVADPAADISNLSNKFSDVCCVFLIDTCCYPFFGVDEVLHTIFLFLFFCSCSNQASIFFIFFKWISINFFNWYLKFSLIKTKK